MSNDTTKIMGQEEETPKKIKSYDDELDSLAGDIDRLQQAEDAAKAELDTLKANRDTARTNRTSVLGAIVEKQKPTYDEKREKRMRSAAIIRSLGDVLAAATQGFHAYGKKGAGVVLTPPPSNAMEGVNKISEMQKKYLEQRKAWEDLSLKWEEQKANDDYEAAEALVVQGEKDYEAAKAERKALAKRKQDIEDHLRDTEVKEAQRQKERKEDLEDYEKKAKISAKYTKRSGGGGRSSKTKPTYDNGRLLYELNPSYIGEDGEIKKSFDALSAGVQKSYEGAASNSDEVAVLNELINEGVEMSNAVALIKSLKETAGEDYYKDVLEQLMEDYIEVYGGADMEQLIEDRIVVLQNWYGF